MKKIVFLRHGESVWNKENRFTGWTDVPLSEKGIQEAREAGRLLREGGYTFDIAYTSVLKRAIKTLWIVMEEMDLMWIPVMLELFGFEWDGRVEYQSHRRDRYDAVLATLQRDGRIYPCSCSRSALARLARSSDGEPVYPGICRSGPSGTGLPKALRFHAGEPGRRTGFQDWLQGWFEQDVAAEVGDFIVLRRDGHAAYQLAVVVDDAAQGVTEVVRGCDLLDNTPRQILLQHALGLPTPEYCHLPLLTEADGSKLANRRHSVPLDPPRAPELLHVALTLLGQSPPADLRSAALATLWEWAFAHWSLAPLRGVKTISL